MEAFVNEENHVRCWMLSTQGPIESVLDGIGRRALKLILAASDRNSTQLFTNAQRPVRGQMTLNKDTYPN